MALTTPSEIRLSSNQDWKISRSKNPRTYEDIIETTYCWSITRETLHYRTVGDLEDVTLFHVLQNQYLAFELEFQKRGISLSELDAFHDYINAMRGVPVSNNNIGGGSGFATGGSGGGGYAIPGPIFGPGSAGKHTVVVGSKTLAINPRIVRLPGPILESSVIQVLKLYKAKLREFCDDLVAVHGPSLATDMFISGSYLPCVVNNKPFSDIDVYFKNQATADYVQKIYAVHEDLVLEAKVSQYGQNPGVNPGVINLLTVKTNFEVPVNYILFKIGNPKDIVTGFDFRMLQWFYEPSSDKMTVYPKAWEDMYNMKLTATKRLDANGSVIVPTVTRVAKYVNRGFTLNTEENFQNPVTTTSGAY